jgi:hypothetical protein
MDDQATQTLQQIGSGDAATDEQLNDYSRQSALLAIAVADINAGRCDAARKALSAFKPQNLQADAPVEMAYVAANCGDYAGALRTSMAITRGDGQVDPRSEAIELIAAAEARGGKVADAGRWALTLKSTRLRAHALLGIAEGMLGHGRLATTEYFLH